MLKLTKLRLKGFFKTTARKFTDSILSNEELTREDDIFNNASEFGMYSNMDDENFIENETGEMRTFLQKSRDISKEEFLAKARKSLKNVPTDQIASLLKQLIEYVVTSHTIYSHLLLTNPEVSGFILELSSKIMKQSLNALHFDLFVFFGVAATKVVKFKQFLPKLGSVIFELVLKIEMALKNQLLDVRTLIRILQSSLILDLPELSEKLASQILGILETQKGKDLEFHYLIKVMMNLTSPLISGWDKSNKFFRIVYQSNLLHTYDSMGNLIKFLRVASETNIPLEFYKNALVEQAVKKLELLIENKDIHFSNFGDLLVAFMKFPDNPLFKTLRKRTLAKLIILLETQIEFRPFKFTEDLFSFLWQHETGMRRLEDSEDLKNSIVKYFNKPISVESVFKSSNIIREMLRIIVLFPDNKVETMLQPCIREIVRIQCENDRISALAFYIEREQLRHFLGILHFENMFDREKPLAVFLNEYHEFGFDFPRINQNFLKFDGPVTAFGFLHLIKIDSEVMRVLIDSLPNKHKMHISGMMNLFSFADKFEQFKEPVRLMFEANKGSFINLFTILPSKFIFYEGTPFLYITRFFRLQHLKLLHTEVVMHLSMILQTSSAFKYQMYVNRNVIMIDLLNRFKSVTGSPKEFNIPEILNLAERFLSFEVFNDFLGVKNQEFWDFFIALLKKYKIKLSPLFALKCAQVFLHIPIELMDFSGCKNFAVESKVDLFMVFKDFNLPNQNTDICNISEDLFDKLLAQISDPNSKVEVDLIMLIKSAPVIKLRLLKIVTNNSCFFIKNHYDYLVTLILSYNLCPDEKLFENLFSFFDPAIFKDIINMRQFYFFLYNTFMDKPADIFIRKKSRDFLAYTPFNEMKYDNTNFMIIQFMTIRFFIPQNIVFHESVRFKFRPILSFVIHYIYSTAFQIREGLEILERAFVNEIPMVFLCRMIILYFYEFEKEIAAEKIGSLILKQIRYDEKLPEKLIKIAIQIIGLVCPERTEDFNFLANRSTVKPDHTGNNYLQSIIIWNSMNLHVTKLLKEDWLRGGKLTENNILFIETSAFKENIIDPESWAVLKIRGIQNCMVINLSRLNAQTFAENKKYLQKLLLEKQSKYLKRVN